MTDEHRCSICHETFAKARYARRCEAQGVPPFVYMVGDILRRERVPPLKVIRRIQVHHGFGKCPINGPCEHAVSYEGYHLWPNRWGNHRSWVAGLTEDLPWPNYHRVGSGRTRIGRLTRDWGIIPEHGKASDYMTGPDVDEDWDRLWDLHPRGRQGRTRRMALEDVS